MLPTEVILVNLLLLVGLVLWTLEAPAHRWWARLAAVLLLQVLTLGYISWRYNQTLPDWQWTPEALYPWTFFAYEMAALVYEMWSLGVLVAVSSHSAEADAYERGLRCRCALPTVDVLIPTCSEGKEILEETIRGALALDYPRERLRIWLLDDGRRPWLRALCAQYGVGYFARPTNEHGKAGNLNYAFARTSGQYLLVIDADFILERRFLYRTLGFLLARPEIGLVQTPQHFRNPDPIQHNLLGVRAWTEEQHFFMTMVESARDFHGNAFCVGSGWLVRRTCLDELGGFPQDSICEDLEVSYALLARGYRTLFLNEPLAVGLAPESVTEYIKQRVRWCTGTIQHLFIKTGPLRASGLALRDRLFYLEPILFWLTFPFIVLLLLAPLVYWFTGISAIHARGEEAALVLLPRFLAGYILIYWLSERKVMPPITAVHKVFPAFHLTAALLKALVHPFGSPFKVTDKGGSREGIVVQWPLLMLFLSLFLALLGGMVMNLSGFCEMVEVGGVTALDVAWTCYSLLLLGLCILTCVEQPKGSGYLNAEAEVRHGSVRETAAALLKRLFA